MLNSKLLKLLSLSLIITFFTINGGGAQNSGNLRIVITGFSSDQGIANIGLVNSKKAFKTRKGGIPGHKGVSLKIEDKRVDYTFEDIPFGEYAVKYYHDVNSNNKLDVNFLGIPKEPYGFSNDTQGSFKLPNYKKARFLFDKDGMIIEIKVNK